MAQRAYVTKQAFNRGIVSSLVEVRDDYDGIRHSCRQLKNFKPLLFGGADYRNGTHKVPYSEMNIDPISVPFVVDSDNVYTIELGMIGAQQRVCRVIYNKEFITGWINMPTFSLDAGPINMFDNYGVSNLKFKQVGNTLYIAQKKQAFVKLVRKSHMVWDCVEVTINDIFDVIEQISSGELSLNLTSKILTSPDASIFVPYLTNYVMRLFIDDIEYVWSANRSIPNPGSTVALYGKNFYLHVGTAATTGDVPPTHTHGTVSDGKALWKYIHSGYIDLIIKSVTGKTATIEYVDANQAHSNDNVIVGTKYQFGGLYYLGTPTDVELYKNRLALAIDTSYSGSKVYFSQTNDDYEKFDYLSFGEVTDTTGIDVPLRDTSESINWISSHETLFVGTFAGIHVVQALTLSAVFSAVNSTTYKLNSLGSNRVSPIRLDDDIVYCDKYGKNLQLVSYSLQKDSLKTIDLSVLYTELDSDYYITSMTYLGKPDYSIICTMKDSNKLLNLLIEQQQQINAFYIFETNAVKVINVSSSPNIDKGYDELWQTVKRNSEIKQSHLEYYSDDVFLDYAKIAESVSHDITGGSTYGDDNYIGKIVTAVKDNDVLIAEGDSAGNAHFEKDITGYTVGFGYEGILEPLPIYLGDIQNGSTMAKRQRINKIIAFVKDCYNFKFGYDDKYSNSKLKKDVLSTGELILDWPGNDTTNKTSPELDRPITSGARIVIKQDKPFKTTILALTSEVIYDEN